MPGRIFVISETSKIVSWLNIGSFAKFSIISSYNIAPTQDLPAVVATPQGRRLGTLRWGLIPHWAKDESIGHKMINARAETVAEKPSFKGPLRSKRCVIPIDGYYEWKPTDDGKIPHVIKMKDSAPFALAGLWDNWKNHKGEKISTVTTITTTPNKLIEPIHHRMPVILDDAGIDIWLNDRIEDPQQLTPLLKPCSATKMEAYIVSSFVNAPKNNTEECIEPI